MDAYGNLESYSIKNGEEAISNERINGMSIDRLSALPDDLLIRILSRLGTERDVFLGYELKRAAITCVLSKRWRFLWCDMPRLNFRDYMTEPENKRKFVSRVHRTIIFRSSSYMDKFSVQFWYDESYALDVNAWICFALMNKVKDLSVHLQSSSCPHTPPLLLYLDSSLTRMSLESCILAPPRNIEWPHLTHLRVEDVELPQQVLEKISSGCPVLYYLCLISCWGFNNISSESLRELELELSGNHGQNSMDLYLLVITAPHLRSLDLDFSPINTKLRLTNLPSLDRAKFFYTDFDDSVETMNSTMELLEKTKHAKLLVLGCMFVEVLSEMVTHGWQLPQSRRLQLTLETSSDEDIIPVILCLLESSPSLQNLRMECILSSEESPMDWGPSPRNDLDCDLLNLKIVRLLNCADPVFDGEPMLTMARILLKRATMLEKMVITQPENLNGPSLDFTMMSEKVLSYPRSSERAVIVFPLLRDEYD